MDDPRRTSIPGVLRGGAMDIVALALAIGLFVQAVGRGLDQPSNYAFSHWLLDWRHGFIKRGLVGTVLHPLLVNKTPREVQFVVGTLCTVTLTLTFVALLGAAWRVWRDRGSAWFLGPTLLAFVASPAIVVAASTIGFFDHLLTLATVGALAAVARGRYTMASVLSVLALLVHEAFTTCGLPLVLFAMVLKATGDGARGAGLVRRIGPWVAAPIVTLVWMSWSQATLPADRIEGVRSGLAETGAIDAERIDNAVYHLEHGLGDNLRRHSGDVLERVLDPTIGRVVWPALTTLLGAGSALLVAAGRRAWVVGLVAASLAPEVTLLFAADTTRFTNLTIVQAFLGLTAVTWIVGIGPVSRRVAWVLSGLAVLSIAASLAWRVPLLSARVDGEGVFVPRDEPPVRKR